MIPEQTLLGFPLFGDNATKVEPDNNKKSNGWQQGDVVPAEWMNWEWYHASKGVADLNKGVTSMEKEINNVLSSFGISPAEATNNQLLTAMRLNASFVTAASTTITGPLLIRGGTIRVMFTAALLGSDTTTKLTLSYNTQNIDVKVIKNGAKTNFVATEVSTGTYKYLQAYSTLELVYDGVDFLVVGNPVVLSGNNYTVYADGQKHEIKQFDLSTLLTGLISDARLYAEKNDKFVSIKCQNITVRDLIPSGGSLEIITDRNPIPAEIRPSQESTVFIRASTNGYAHAAILSFLSDGSVILRNTFFGDSSYIYGVGTGVYPLFDFGS